METIAMILLIAAAIIGIIIVNLLYKLYMKIMNIDYFIFDGKKKLIYIIIVSGGLWLMFLKIFLRI